MTNVGVNPNSTSLTHEELDELIRTKRDRVVKIFGSDFITYNIKDNPVTFKDVMASSEAKQWKEGVKSEMDSFVSNGTWVLVDLPPGCTNIGLRAYMVMPLPNMQHVACLLSLWPQLQIACSLMHSLFLEYAFCKLNALTYKPQALLVEMSSSLIVDTNGASSEVALILLKATMSSLCSLMKWNAGCDPFPAVSRAADINFSSRISPLFRVWQWSYSLVIFEDDASRIGSSRSFHSEVEATMVFLTTIWTVSRSAL
ncbi:hypothetical protein Sango_2782900 [Sesamum angolense]|uniref:Uncharacterized protein n=1 Tax=Sesamum angolense TaxID=2727404 RepID=A0AAE1T8C5_9LAMI|nr:hypothetical protein Sango_2782900 [Sesamum angolense]